MFRCVDIYLVPYVIGYDGLGYPCPGLPRFRVYIWPVCFLVDDDVTVYDKMSHFNLLIVRAVSKYRVFSQRLIGTSEEMKMYHILAQKTAISFATIGVFLYFSVFSWFRTILAKNIQDSFARINQSHSDVCFCQYLDGQICSTI